MRFTIARNKKKLIFDSELLGLKVNGIKYISEKDGVLIYDKTQNISSNEVELQMSTNTSTLIPALRILKLSYDSYFDGRPVVESQNDITFYWNPSKLAAYYNKFSTDGLDFYIREPIICKAVDFILFNSKTIPLMKESLNRLSQPCRLLGFYQGFPIFDNSVGFAKLLSRLGIHIDKEGIMISTPINKYEKDVYELAEELNKKTETMFSKKKNRVFFIKNQQLLKLLGIKESDIM